MYALFRGASLLACQNVGSYESGFCPGSNLVGLVSLMESGIKGSEERTERPLLDVTGTLGMAEDAWVSSAGVILFGSLHKERSMYVVSRLLSDSSLLACSTRNVKFFTEHCSELSSDYCEYRIGRAGDFNHVSTVTRLSPNLNSNGGCWFARPSFP